MLAGCLGSHSLKDGCQLLAQVQQQASDGWEKNKLNLTSSNHRCSVIFVNENENGEKRENNEFVNEN